MSNVFDKIFALVTPWFGICLRLDDFFYRRKGWCWTIKLKNWRSDEEC